MPKKPTTEEIVEPTNTTQTVEDTKENAKAEATNVPPQKESGELGESDLPAVTPQSAVAISENGIASDDDLSLLFDTGSLMNGVVPRLPEIKIIHQGQTFKMPDGKKTETIDAIILDQNLANAWWLVPFNESGGGDMPTCYSYDGIHPAPDVPEAQGESCMKCKFNEFGSDRSGSGGKDCSNVKRVHLMLPGSDLPHRLTLSVMNIVPFDIYVSVLAGRRRPYPTVRTRISLKTATNKKGIEYSEIVFNAIEDISDMKELKAISACIKSWQPIMRKQEILSSEV